MRICAEKYAKMKRTIQNSPHFMNATGDTYKLHISVSMLSNVLMCLVADILLATVGVGIRQWNCDVCMFVLTVFSLCFYSLL